MRVDYGMVLRENGKKVPVGSRFPGILPIVLRFCVHIQHSIIITFWLMRAVVVVLQPPFYCVRILVFEEKARKTFPFLLRCVIEREGGIESRQFQVDILTLVAVALGQEFFFFRFQRGLEGFGFGPVLVGQVVGFFSFAGIFSIKNVGFSPNNRAHF